MKKHYNLKAITQGVKAFVAILMVTLVSMSGLLAQTAQYQLVSEDQTDWSGTYLLTAPHNTQGIVALSGFSTTSTVYGTFTALNDLVSEGTIESNATTDAMQLTIASTGNGTYTIATTNGEYLGWTSGNSLAHASAVSSDKYEWTLYFDNGNLRISNANTPVRMLQWNASSPRFACYGNTNQTACSLYKLSVVAPVLVAAPALTPGTGTYYVPQTVSMSAQNGATIYYTTDGTTPTANSTEYTEPFIVNDTTTVKAIAVDGEDVSTVTTAVYTVTLPVEVANIAAFKANGVENTLYKITGDVKVIGQYSNKYHTFIQDNTGALYIYGTMANAYNEGDVISGGVYGTYSLYNGLNEMKSNAAYPAAEGVAGTAIQPVVVTLAALVDNYADYEGKLVTVIGVTATQDRTFGTSNSTKGANITQNDATVQIYNTWGAITGKQISQGDVLNVTGYVIRYNNTVEIVPRSTNDIVMAIAELPYTLDFDSNVDDGFAIDNATATNKWYIGQASDFDNNKLFISNNGVTNKYTNAASNAYASRTLRIPAAGALLSFDYRVMGENNYDYLKVAIVKDGNETVLAKLNGTNEWTNASYVIDPSLAGVVDLMFTWTNDASGANQFPAAVDNISVIENPCSPVSNVTATVSGTTATIAWTPGVSQNAWTVEYKPTDHSEWHSISATSPSVTLADLTGNTNYNVRVKANCGATNSVWTTASFAIDCQNLTIAPADVEVGTGTVNGYYAPFNNYYRNSWNQCVYPASEIGSAGNIYSIAWNCAATASLTLSNVKIYLGTTPNSTITSTSDWLPMSDLTLVYEGNNVAIGSSTGWENYTLNAPFYYNGTDNLVVVVSKTASSYSSAIKYYYTSVTNSMMYRQNDSDASYAQHPGSNTGTRSTYRANIKLNMDAMVCGDVPACTEPTNLTVSNITTSEAEIAWTAGADETAWTVEYRPANSESWTAAQVAEPNFVLNGLNANTAYVVRVAANCGTTNSEYIAVNFTTLPSCLAPTNITNINNLNNTSIHWTAANGETAWVVEYKEATATEWNTLNITNEPQLVLSNLANSTLYDVRVKAVCDENNESAWTNFQFTSDCGYTALPYVEDFERFATNTQPDCWSSLNNTWPTNSWPMVYVNNSSTYVHNGSLSLYFKSSSTTSVYAVMPAFDAQNLKVTFFYRNEGTSDYNGILSIGTMSDPADESTFTEVSTFARTTTFTEETVNFINLNGARVAFRYTGGTGNNYYIGIDDISVEAITDCASPTQLAASNMTSTTADLDWAAGNEETSWQIEYGVTGFAHGAGTVVTANAPAYSLTGLTASTAYDVYVRAICGANQYSEWSDAITFTTEGCEEADKCTFTLNMTDSYGDGWNGNYILVEVDGEYYDEFTIETGTTNTATIKICDNQTFTLTWEDGSYASECSYTLVKDGETIFSGSGSQSGVFYTQHGCTNETPGGCDDADKCIFTLNMEDSYGDGWNGASIKVLVNGIEKGTYSVSGYSNSVDIAICDEEAFSLSWTSGSYDDECSYTVVKDGETLFSGSGSQSGIFFTQEGCSISAPSDECAQNLPYSEDFESYTSTTSYSSFSSYPDCWDMIFSGTGQGYRPHVYNGTYSPTGTKAIVFTSGSAAYGSDNYAILPSINGDLNNVQMSFKYRMESTSQGKLYVGYLTNPTDGSTFVQLANPTNYTTGTNYEISFAGHNIPAGARIAFKWSLSTSFYCCGIDDIFVEQIPTCPKPAITNVVATQTSATVTVGTISNATDYEIVYGEVGFNPETATPIAVGANNTVVISGLTHSTEYQVYARAICSATDQSLWSNVYNFQTECGIYSLPYNEDFEGVTSTTTISTTVFPKCWNHEFTGTSTFYGPSIYASSTYSYSGVNSLRFYLYKTTSTSASYGDAIAILPEFSTDLNVLGMKFYARKYSTSYASEFEVGVVTDINDPFASFIPVQTINPSSTAYNFYSVSFADYTGANGHIAFRAKKDVTGSGSYNYAYIDDITVEQVIFNKDIELVSVEPIADACDLTGSQLTIKVKNSNASGAISSFTASYQQNGGATVTETVTPSTPIAVGAEYTYTFTAAPTFVLGANNFNISVAYPGDGNEVNNVLTLGPVYLLEPTAIPYAEDFSDVVMGQGGWTVGARNDNPVMWSVVNGTPTYTCSDEFNASSYMVSPCLYIPAGQTMISYDYNALDVLPENLVVYIGTSDQPADWTPIGQHNNFTHSNNAYHVDYNFNNTESGVYFIIVKAASVRGSMGVTFDNLNISSALTVNITTDANGTTNPNGEVTVAAGNDLNINIYPNAGYHVASITVDGQVVAGEDAMNAMVYPFTLENITSNTNVNVAFAENTVKVVKIAGNHGQFVPATTDNVAYGAAHTVTAVADPHYHLNALTVANYDGGIGVNVTNDVVANGTMYTYTFDHVYVDKYVTATFRIDTVGIHYTVLGNGVVDNHVVDSAAQFDRYVDYGTTFSAMFIPAIGYHVAGVTINGVFYGNINEWQFANLSGEQYVTVVFEKNVYTITTAGYGQGTVSDGESFEYDPDHTYTFTATPANGYHIESILRNNVELTIADPEATYTETLTNILSDYNYNVVFNPSQYTVTATAGANGLITPAGVTSYYYNNQALYNVTADLGYYISGITIDGVEVDLDPSLRLTTFTHTFTFTGTMAHNHTINATFARLQYTVTVDAGAHGTITPGTSTYNYGATPTFTIAPAAGYGIVDVTVDGHSVGAVSSYTFTSLTGNHTIAATFAQYEYTIQASAGNGGTITPSGLINAVHGGTQNFTITPATGYHIAAIYVDGQAADVASQYTFANIDANHTIHAMFDQNTYTVTVNQPANGNITPGTMTVNHGATPTFVVTPNTGYNVTAITVNGSNVISSAVNTNGVYTYTMAPVTANATVTATMTQRTFTINATAGAHGTINGPATVNYGANATYTITPAAGYVVDNVTVDGMTAGAVTSYTFTNVVANHTINATFRTEDCDVPTNMHTIDVTTSTATFMWYHPTATAFEVQYKAVDAAAYTTVNVNAMSYDVIDLTPSTSYVWMVRANCGNGNYSEWSNGNIFRTLDVPDIHDGIEDYNVKEMVNVYASHSNVYIVNEGNLQIDNVQIFDVYGKMVYNGNVSSNNEVISLNVATGAYMVRLTTDKGMATYKVVLTK